MIYTVISSYGVSLFIGYSESMKVSQRIDILLDVEE